MYFVAKAKHGPTDGAVKVCAKYPYMHNYWRGIFIMHGQLAERIPYIKPVCYMGACVRVCQYGCASVRVICV